MATKTTEKPAYNLPALPAAVDVPSLPQASATPYVVFASVKSRKWDDMKAAIPNLQEPQPVLIEDGQYTRLDTFKCFLIGCKQFWAATNSAGDIIRATFKDPGRGQEGDLHEHITCVLLVIKPDGSLVPARCEFKRGLTKGAHTLVEAYALASDPAAWAKRSAKHAFSVGAGQPGYRFVATITTRMQTSKATGNKYPVSSASVTPSAADDLMLLNQAFKDEAFNNAINDVFDGHIARLNTVQEKAA